MVKTKAEVKLKIKEWIDKKEEPFTTQQIKEEISPIASNIHLSPNRLTNFIRAAGNAEFNKKKKTWIRTTSFIDLRG